MLEKRLFKPKKNQLLYHYCTSETFNSICTFKSLRFSDIFSMNDFLEIHWGYDVWEKAANQIFDEVDKEFLDEVDKIMSSSGINISILASCLSLEGDVLSQWRAYADDGFGYCIGFDAKTLLNLPASPLQVLYDEKKQINEICNLLRKLYKYVNQIDSNEKYGEDFFKICATLSADISALKNPAFSEEKEVRLIHLLNFEKSNNFLKLADSDGEYFGDNYEKKEVKFKMSNNLPVPYIDIDFTNKGLANPIKEVILGPKNDSRQTAISVYLETLNIPNVIVKKSSASYR